NPVVFWAVELMRPGLEARFGGRKAEMVEPGITEPVEPTMAAAGPAVTDAPTTAAIDLGAHGADDDTGEPSRQTDHTVLVGYGQVGRIVAAGIKEAGG